MDCTRILRRGLDPRREDGVALILVLAVIVLFSITTATAVSMSQSAQGTSSDSSAQQTSYGLAETGINDALGVIENVPSNDPANPNLLGSAASPNVTTGPNGSSVSWYGVYDSTNRIWTITSSSTVKNPVAGASALHNTLTRTVTFTASLNGNWDRIYQDDATQCLTVPDGTNILSNVTAHGDLCVTGATIGGPTSTVTVGGNTTLTPGPQTPTPTGSINATVGAGWTTPQGVTTAGDAVWATYTFPAVVGSLSPALTAAGFGFAIPANATINGIEVHVIHKGNNKNKINDSIFQLMKAGVHGGTSEPAGGWDNPPNGQNQKYGGPADLWGQTWTPADINNASFGTYLVATNTTAAAQIGSIDDIYIIVTYSPPGNDVGIGTSAAPVKEADLGGTCNYNAQGAHTPCTATDHVWGTKITTGPPAMNKPTADFNYWYNNAAPGPKHPCTTFTGTPPVFDNNSTYDNSDSTIKIAGTGVASYTCVAKDVSGNVIGQLSWNLATQVLTISGVVFIDGEADFGSGPGSSVIHYQGRGAIYAPGGSHIDVPVCAGGTGSVSCVTTGMSNWDPSQNLLVMVVGDKEAAGHNDCKIDETTSAFQGVYWSKNTCDIKGGGGAISGPIIASDISIGAGTQFYPWPPLGAILPGVNAGAATYAFTLGNQIG